MLTRVDLRHRDDPIIAPFRTITEAHTPRGDDRGRRRRRLERHRHHVSILSSWSLIGDVIQGTAGDDALVVDEVDADATRSRAPASRMLDVESPDRVGRERVG